ncbi:MAG: nicotinate phosphoribosyltransferase, partial [Deltaproteobacteria bacterium]|nr:nicotinate phosphoribosyltransferase [Deltaproteobacteria bacterium]
MTTTHRIGPLFTDLYELTMAAAYYQKNMQGNATFSLFVRESAARNFFVTAGLETVLDELTCFRFSTGEIAYLKDTGLF